MPLGDFHDRIHVGHLAKQMHGNDGLGTRRDGALQLPRIQRVGLFVDVDKHWLGAAITDRFSGRHEGVRHRDDFIAGPDALGKQCQPEGLGAAADPHGNTRLTVRGEILLQLRHHRTAGERASINDLPDGGEQLGPQGVVLGSQIKERYLLGLFFHGKISSRAPGFRRRSHRQARPSSPRSPRRRWRARQR